MFLEKISLTEEAFHHIKRHVHHPALSGKRRRSFAYLTSAPRSIPLSITDTFFTFPPQKACISTEAWLPLPFKMASCAV